MTPSDEESRDRSGPGEAEEPDRPEKEKTPLAVAVKDGTGSAGPRVIATGRGGVAEQILQIAFANDIKVREDADLVEVLAAIDVESEIPLEAFAAVAEILSYVYRANAGLTPPPATDGDTP